MTLASQLEEEWLTLRWLQKDNPLERFLADEYYEPSNAPLISNAKDIYLHSKGDGRPITFSQAVERAVGNLVNAVGDYGPRSSRL